MDGEDKPVDETDAKTSKKPQKSPIPEWLLDFKLEDYDMLSETADFLALDRENIEEQGTEAITPDVATLGQQDVRGIVELIKLFAFNVFCASDNNPQYEIVMKECLELFKKDYDVGVIENKDGILSKFYPPSLIVLEGAKGSASKVVDVTKMAEILPKAHLARCRQRFPMPVILYKKKMVCRSATLASGLEIVANKATLAIKTVIQECDSINKVVKMMYSPAVSEDQETSQFGATELGWLRTQEKQMHDVELLHLLNVGLIMDLMVENRKFKLLLYVTSSEKFEKDSIYHKNFSLACTPYPGCEFFKEFADKNNSADGLMFDWEQSYCDAEFSLPDEGFVKDLDIDFSLYKTWDLVKITRNYLKLILKRLEEDDDKGILIHCISGWDRTPLFISLVRISLWADGVIHQNLNEAELLYLTIAYDWMLFGHQLTARLNKKEHIFLFCFFFLKYILDDEFSVVKLPRAATPRFSSAESSQQQSPSSSRSRSTVTSEDLEFDHVRRPGKRLRVSTEQRYANGGSNLPIVIFDSDSNESFKSIAAAISDAISPSGRPSSNQSSESAELLMELDEERDQLTAIPKTEPINIPSRRESGRSTPEMSGSWQLVTETGSLDSQSRNSPNLSFRRKRLTNLRNLFYNCYFKALPEEIIYRMPGSTFSELFRVFHENNH